MQTRIDVTTLRDLLEAREPLTILDVRSGDEWAEWAIPGSVHADVHDALEAGEAGAMDGLDLPAGRPVVTV